MRPLLPTLKERKRYLVYEIITSNPMRADVSRELVDALSGKLGVFGMAEAGILSVSYDAGSQTGILRVAHTALEKVRAAMTMTTHLGRTPVLIRTLGVSGILGKSTRFLPDGANHKLGRK